MVSSPQRNLDAIGTERCREPGQSSVKLDSRARCLRAAEMPLFSSRLCVKWLFGVFFIWPSHTLSPLEGKWQPRVKTLLKNYEIPLNLRGRLKA